MSRQPEALRLAWLLKDRYGEMVPTSQAAAELRRLHAEISQLRAERPSIDAIYAAWRAVGADVAGLDWQKFVGALS